MNHCMLVDGDLDMSAKTHVDDSMYFKLESYDCFFVDQHTISPNEDASTSSRPA